MSRRLWLVPVGEQPAAVIGPLLTAHRPGDVVQFVVSERTRELPRAIARALDRSKCHIRWLTPAILPPFEMSGSTAVVAEAFRASGRNRPEEAVLVANGGTKEWLYRLREELHALSIPYEWMLSQNACLTRATRDEQGGWCLSSQRLRGLQRDALCELLGVTWHRRKKVLSRDGNELALSRLEAHHNYLWAWYQVRGHSKAGRNERKGRLTRSDLRALGLEERRVFLSSFRELTDGEPTSLTRRGFTVLGPEGVQRRVDFLLSAIAGGEIPAEVGVEVPLRSGMDLTESVGVLVLGTRGGGLINQMDALLRAGATSLLFVADGAEEHLQGTVAVLGDLLHDWKGRKDAAGGEPVPWDALWFQRHADSGMPGWKNAPEGTPTSDPSALASAIAQRLGTPTVQLFVHLKPGDKLLSWAMWEATQQLPERFNTTAVFDIPTSSVAPDLRMRLQAGVVGLEAEKYVRLSRTEVPAWEEADERVLDALHRVLQGRSHVRPEYLIERLKNAAGRRSTDWFPWETWTANVGHTAGHAFERAIALRLAMALRGTDTACIWISLKDAVGATRTIDNEADVVTLVGSGREENFVVWEAKYRRWSSQEVSWRGVYGKADRFTPCHPDKTHAVVVVPRLPHQMEPGRGREWLGEGHMLWWGLHYIDWRVLFDDEALRHLAQRGAHRASV